MDKTRFRVTLLLAVATRPQAAGRAATADPRDACQSQHSLRVEHHHAFERCGALLLMPQKRGMHVCTLASHAMVVSKDDRRPTRSRRRMAMTNIRPLAESDARRNPDHAMDLISLVIMSNHGSADLHQEQITAWTSLAQRVLWRYRVSQPGEGRACRHSTCVTPLAETTLR